MPRSPSQASSSLRTSFHGSLGNDGKLVEQRQITQGRRRRERRPVHPAEPPTTLADKVVSPDTVSDSTVPTILTVSVEAAKGDVAAHGEAVPERGVTCDGDRIRQLVTQVHIAVCRLDALHRSRWKPAPARSNGPLVLGSWSWHHVERGRRWRSVLARRRWLKIHDHMCKPVVCSRSWHGLPIPALVRELADDSNFFDIVWRADSASTRF